MPRARRGIKHAALDDGPRQSKRAFALTFEAPRAPSGIFQPDNLPTPLRPHPTTARMAARKVALLFMLLACLFFSTANAGACTFCPFPPRFAPPPPLLPPMGNCLPVGVGTYPPTGQKRTNTRFSHSRRCPRPAPPPARCACRHHRLRRLPECVRRRLHGLRPRLPRVLRSMPVWLRAGGHRHRGLPHPGSLLAVSC